MKIAIIGSGKVGGALATTWAEKGHKIFIGARDTNSFKSPELLSNPNTSLHTVNEAVSSSEVILLATPAKATIEVVNSLGDTTGKIIIDAMNAVNNTAPEGYTNTADAVLANTSSKDVVKCFNTTGFNNMLNPVYDGVAIDAFCCGESEEAKKVAIQLALDAGFGECYDIGGNQMFKLMEDFAFFWINLAIFRGQGREIGFKLLKR